jgi:hypothetical protein
MARSYTSIVDNEKTYNINAVKNNESRVRLDTDAEYGDGEKLGGITKVYDDLLLIPNWSFEDFYNERTKFRKQGLSDSGVSAYNDRGSFFYKVFFNFHSNYGLLGSLIKTPQNAYSHDENTAYLYLSNNIYGDKFSETYKNVLRAKQKSLESFGKILNYLQMECPWFFKEIGNLAEVSKRDFNEIVPGEEKTISLTFNPDAVDMRISTLLDLYVNACYDTINFKEVIPENLRKFDMSIILFNPPMANLNVPADYIPAKELEEIKKRYRATPENEKRNSKEYNTIHSYLEQNWAGIVKENMSFKCIILKNCEIDLKDLTTTPEAVSNEDGISLEYTIKIKYQRSYIYNLNKTLSIEVLDNMYNEVDNEDFTREIEKLRATELEERKRKEEEAKRKAEEAMKEMANKLKPTVDYLTVINGLPKYVEIEEEEIEEEPLPVIPPDPPSQQYEECWTKNGYFNENWEYERF